MSRGRAGWHELDPTRVSDQVVIVGEERKMIGVGVSLHRELTELCKNILHTGRRQSLARTTRAHARPPMDAMIRAAMYVARRHPEEFRDAIMRYTQEVDE